MGTEPIPICTEGAVPGTLVEANRRPADGTAIGGGVTGPSPGAVAPPGADVGIMVGATSPKLSGSGGTAVFATAMGWPDWTVGSGGGVAGKASGGGATTGFGAGAALCSLAPQPRQNL